MKTTAETFLGKEINPAVVTVPTYFNDAQHQATIYAGIIAEMKVEHIINEPTVTAITYGMDNTGREVASIANVPGGTQPNIP
jgi:molecular chaperone DnaK